MDFSFEPKVTREFLLSQNNEETYMSYYLGIPVTKGLFCSPLRQDNHTTCSFFRGKSGRLYFKDFATGECLAFENVVMKKFGCGYHEALKIIAKDFGLIKGGHPESKPIIKQEKFSGDKQTFIQIEQKEFSKEELAWWAQYGITKPILNKYRVFSCKTVFLNGTIFSQSTPKCPSYGYYFGKKEHIEQWKIYYPTKTDYRFIGNISTKTIQGYRQLPKSGKLLVITKAQKDCMCLYSMGIPACAPQSETQFISDTILEDLKQRFERIVLLFDSDLTGVHYTNVLRKKYDYLIPCIIPRRYGAKDISDFHKKYGRERTIEFIKESIKYIKNEKNLGEHTSNSNL
jgi:hypothetical protein